MTRRIIKRLVAPKLDEERAEVLSTRQFKDLLARAKEGQHGIRNHSIVWHSFGCALRVTEIALLKVSDVITRSGEIKEVVQLPGTYTKNGKARYFFQVDPEQRKALEEYLEYRATHGVHTNPGSKEYRSLRPDSKLYIARGGGFALSIKIHEREDGTVAKYDVSSSLQQLLTRLIQKTGAKNGSSHSGRRTFATRLDAKGVDETLIQAVLGHGSVDQTMAYIRPNLRKIRSAMAGIYSGPLRF